MFLCVMFSCLCIYAWIHCVRNYKYVGHVLYEYFSLSLSWIIWHAVLIPDHVLTLAMNVGYGSMTYVEHPIRVSTWNAFSRYVKWAKAFFEANNMAKAMQLSAFLAIMGKENIALLRNLPAFTWDEVKLLQIKAFGNSQMLPLSSWEQAAWWDSSWLLGSTSPVVCQLRFQHSLFVMHSLQWSHAEEAFYCKEALYTAQAIILWSIVLRVVDGVILWRTQKCTTCTLLPVL